MAGKRRRSSFSQPTMIDPGVRRSIAPRPVPHPVPLDVPAPASSSTAFPTASAPASAHRRRRRGPGSAVRAGATAPGRPGLVPQGELGSGGQGKVLQAFDPHLGRVVAMKVLTPRLVKAPASLQRFVEEARVMAQLDHPNIIPIHDLVVDDGVGAHFVMKLVRGRTLDHLVRQRHAQSSSRHKASDQPHEKATTLRDHLLTFLKVCDAVAFAHDRNIIHCDLKPDNIMVGEFGEAYLTDWGIASQVSHDGRRARSSSPRSGLRGTPDFMSPEQARAAPEGPTKQTDVFGLGAVLYFILTARPPFPGKTASQALARAKKCRYDDPEAVTGTKLPPALVRIVKKALAAEPRDRFATVKELREQVDQLLRGDWHLPTRTYPARTVIVREGEWADAAYIIMSGSCQVSRLVGGKRRILRTLGPGAVFGETAILSGDVRTATVESVEPVVARVVTRELFHDQLGIDSWLARFVLALADRFRELEQRVEPSSGGAAEPRPNQR